tara:strand:- start:1799 stop:2893 length:1095 start_codon:yes stop_codon:yes gene_type:complete
MQTKRIAFFVTALDSGGLENYLLRFLGFAKENIQATVYCKAGYIGNLEEDYLEVGAKIIPFKLGMFTILDYYKLFKEFKLQNYDAVVDFTGNFAAFPLATAMKAGVKKRIAFYRGSTNHFKEDFWRLKYNNYLNFLIPKVATSVLANSKAALNFFFENIWEKDEQYGIVYNGIDQFSFLTTKKDLRKELNIPLNAFVVGHVGRYNIAKNHSTLIKVAFELCKNNSNIYFIFCGNKTIENLSDEVKKENLDLQIKLLGFRKDIINVLNTLDCFYFPSITEGQPNALIEAMMVGLPFVASDIEPIRETVSTKYSSQLINPFDWSLAVKKILDLEQNNTVFDTKLLSETAIRKYNANQQFNKFLKYL